MTWQRIGEVPVDSAHIALVDPMNVHDVARHFEAALQDEAPSMNYELVVNDHGVAVGLIVRSGLGDGTYPIEGRFEEIAPGDLRVAEIRITFLPHPVLGSELP